MRHSTFRKNGKTHTYWRLVRSVRRGTKVHQETVAYLGELDADGHAKASALAKHFLGDRSDQLDFFEDRNSLETVRVKLKETGAPRASTPAGQESSRSFAGRTSNRPNPRAEQPRRQEIPRDGQGGRFEGLGANEFVRFDALGGGERRRVRLLPRLWSRTGERPS